MQVSLSLVSINNTNKRKKLAERLLHRGETWIAACIVVSSSTALKTEWKAAWLQMQRATSLAEKVCMSRSPLAPDLCRSICQHTVGPGVILHPPLNKASLKIGFLTMILTKFSWPLGATCFLEEQCLKIQCNFLPTVLLSKMGINWNTATKVHSGPQLYGGMEVPKLWPIQGSSKNKLMILVVVVMVVADTPWRGCKSCRQGLQQVWCWWQGSGAC